MTQTNLQRYDENSNSNRAWCVYSPDVDVYENDDEFLVVADIPGVDAEHVALDYSNGVLSLSADLGSKDETQVAYRRQFKLPAPVDPDQISAEAKAGELRIRLAKSTQARKRRIEVRAS
jgi:HSP20 family molecular chaperone IbpA